jgi:hypothetical protein
MGEAYLKNHLWCAGESPMVKPVRGNRRAMRRLSMNKNSVPTPAAAYPTTLAVCAVIEYLTSKRSATARIVSGVHKTVKATHRSSPRLAASSG